MKPSAQPGGASGTDKWCRIKAILGIALLLSSGGVCRAQVAFQQTNLVSSVPGLAPVTDPNLKNPWGISFTSAGPFWISNQVTAIATLYDGAGSPFPVGSPLLVTIPTLGGSPSGPTALVFNATSDFELTPNNPGRFLFANLDGTVSGWNPAVSSTTSVIKVAATDGAVYTGLALGNNGSGNFAYAADSANGKIDIYDANFSQVFLAGSFTDPILPAGFAPYNIQNLAGTLYVTYKNDTTGGGIIDAFDPNGNFVRRISANSGGGPLDDPWGLSLAPASFGTFGGALLVGNEGNGHISAFDPLTGQFLGQLLDAQGNPIANPGLWGLTFGNGGNGGDPDALYFAAGISSESEGLFGSIRAGVATNTPTATPNAPTATATATETVTATETATATETSTQTNTPSTTPTPTPTPTATNTPTATARGPRKPDLMQAAVSNPPAAATPGGRFTVTDTVANRGNAAAGPSTTRYYLSRDATDRGKDQLLTGERRVPGLAPLATSTGTAIVTISDKTKRGTYFLLVCADDRHDVPEGDEVNNCTASATTVVVGL